MMEVEEINVHMDVQMLEYIYFATFLNIQLLFVSTGIWLE